MLEADFAPEPAPAPDPEEVRRIAEKRLVSVLLDELRPLCDRPELREFLDELPPRFDDVDAKDAFTCDQQGIWLHRPHRAVVGLLESPATRRVADLAVQIRAALEELIPPPDPREELALALRATLESICAERTEVLTHVDLQAVDYAGVGASQCVSCDRQGIHLHPDHPAVAAGLSRVPPDPMVVLFVASALYTAVNIYLVEVTDEDEDIFHELVANHLVKSRPPEPV
jgi:hypothetical protein